MVNPFDRSFFKFFVGFICILSVSFAIIYFVGRYGLSLGQPSAAVSK
ncbi:MAG: hypothetical protein QOG91_454 [Candidatus Parcubacteria bacterium]|jgi:hypothetical protein|nr:hypothetical protein [Candidatus Parcubacteria bacterium]